MNKNEITLRIVTLIENTPGPKGCAFEHGLSCYFETGRHRILADTGASGAFLRNAEAMGVDLGNVDILFLSHGHYDHAGGIPAFAEQNPNAKIYMQRSAGLDYYSMNSKGPRYIGIPKEILAFPNLVLLDGDAVLDEDVQIFSGITGQRIRSRGNEKLRRKEGEAYLPDRFDHEQVLVLRCGGKIILFSGCAHTGILNILDRFRSLSGEAPDLVISGFHFMKKEDFTAEELADIDETSSVLAGMKKTIFYTGHCTGEPALERMRKIMGSQLHTLHSAQEIPILDLF